MSQTNPPPRRPMSVILFLVLLAAVLVRLGYWLEVRDLPLFQEPTGDAATYVLIAEEMAQDGPLAPLGEAYRQAPLYPFLIRLTGAFGFGLAALRLLQFALGVVGVGLLWRLGARLAGRPGAIAAAVGGALYGPLVFFEGEFLSISFAVFFLEAALVLWGRARWSWACGVLLGLAALAQPNLLLPGLVLAGAALVVPARLGWAGRSGVILLLVGLLAPVTLTAARNLIVAGEPVLISTNGGVNFFIGNNPAADGSFHLPPGSGLLNRPEGLFTSARDAAEADAGRDLSAAEVDRHWWIRGVDFWITEPGKALGLYARKVLLAVNHYEIPNHYDYDYFRQRSVLLRLLPTFGWLLPLGGVGLILAVRRRRPLLPLLFLTVLVSVALFFVTARYRLPLVVPLLPAAGLAVERALAWRRVPARLVPLGLVAAAYVGLAFVPLLAGVSTRVHMLNAEGAALHARGDLPAAERAFREAVELQPDHAEALNNLGRVLALQGQGTDAVVYYRQALRADPLQAETYLNLEEMYRLSGRHEEALEILDRLTEVRGGNLSDVAAAADYRRGVNQFAVGDTTAAVASLEAAVRVDPELTGGWLTLSTVYRKLGQVSASVGAAERAAVLDPESQEAAIIYGAALEEAGNYLEAAGAYQEAMRRGPVDAKLDYLLGRALVRAGRDEDAEEFLLAANQGSPHVDALWELATLYERTERPNDARAAYAVLTRLDPDRAGDAIARLKELGRDR